MFVNAAGHVLHLLLGDEEKSGKRGKKLKKREETGSQFTHNQFLGFSSCFQTLPDAFRLLQPKPVYGLRDVR